MAAARPRVPRLILVTDARRSRWPLLDLVGEAVAGGVDAIYLRGVDPASDDARALVHHLRRFRYDAAVLVNGEPATARSLGVGLHLRERDEHPATARALLGPAVLIGKSAHAPAGAAGAAGADYVLAGHVFASKSKPGRRPLGVSGLRAMVNVAPCPTLAIGGITPRRVPRVVRAGAHGIAVVGAIAEADDPRAAAADLRAALDSAMSAQPKEAAVTEAPGATESAQQIEIVANGKTATVPIGATIHEFLAGRRMTDTMAIVERNGTIVPRAEYGTTELQAGDRLEVVHAVGGGCPQGGSAAAEAPPGTRR